MEDEFLDENRDSKARNRAKKFFQMLTERRQKAKEERDKERVRQRREDVLRKMQELQGETGARQQPVQEVLRPHPQLPPPPEPIVPDPPELTIPEPPKPPGRPAQPDPATVEFLKWCFREREEEEEPSRYRRFPQIYRKRDGRD